MKITEVTYAGSVVQLTFDGGEIFYISATSGGFTASDHIPSVGVTLEPEVQHVLRLYNDVGEVAHTYYVMPGTRVLKEIK